MRTMSPQDGDWLGLQARVAMDFGLLAVEAGLRLQTNLEDTLRQEVSLQDVKSCEDEKKCLLNFWGTM
jgi:hypothetical protein